jgi:1,4-dihydroxy-2-naphthoate polyprenyltransferase
MLKKLLGIARGPFLLLVPAALAPAFATAWLEVGQLSLVHSALIVLAGLASHIAVNALNEYDDFRTGLDFATQKTPFSGGSGTLVAHPEFALVALFVGWLGVLITFTIGLFFLREVGSQLIAPGLLGLAIIVAYTRWINRFPILCLLAPGLGFGLLMVNLAVLVLTGKITALSVWVSVPVTLLVSNLLLVNQLPDIEADQRVGRRHIPIAWGEEFAGWVSVALLTGAYFSVIVGCLIGPLPVGALLALLTIPAAILVGRKVVTFSQGNAEQLIPAMGTNVAVTLLTPLLLAVGVVIG